MPSTRAINIPCPVAFRRANRSSGSRAEFVLFLLLLLLIPLVEEMPVSAGSKAIADSRIASRSGDLKSPS